MVATPMGLSDWLDELTQGSRVAATLGWRPKSRWDFQLDGITFRAEYQSARLLVGLRSKTSLNECVSQ
jgi:hypothetical protein